MANLNQSPELVSFLFNPIAELERIKTRHRGELQALLVGQGYELSVAMSNFHFSSAAHLAELDRALRESRDVVDRAVKTIAQAAAEADAAEVRKKVQV